MEKQTKLEVLDRGSSSTDTGLDDAAAWVSQRSQEIDPVVERRVRKKIDMFFMPTFILGYGLVYYDKAILGSASLFGMLGTKTSPYSPRLLYIIPINHIEGDLHLSVVVNATTKPPTTSTQRLSWASALFYFGMLCGLYPMTLLVQRFRIGRVLPILIIVWVSSTPATLRIRRSALTLSQGAVAMCTAAVTNHQGLYAQRFFLGFVESVIPTTFMTIISSYYTQQEQAFRQSWWFSSTGLFTIIGGALNYGFAQVSSGDLKRWQYIYIFGSCRAYCFASRLL